MRARLLFATGFLLLLVVRPAQAVTIEEIIQLSRAGLGADVLVALVDTSDSVFTVDAARVLELKSAGVPERVILALIAKGRGAQDPGAPPPTASAATAAAPAATPSVVVINDDGPCPQPAPVIVSVPVAYPFFIGHPHAPIGVVQRQPVPTGIRRSGRFINDGFGVTTTPTIVGEPVYWGWGGKLRPDAWGQPRQRTDVAADAASGTRGPDARQSARR